MERGIRQGDTVSAVHGNIRKHIPKTDLENQMPDERMIDREYLSHLCFADDILIWDNIPNELQQMPQELADERGCQGLKMTKLNTKGMMENSTPL